MAWTASGGWSAGADLDMKRNTSRSFTLDKTINNGNDSHLFVTSGLLAGLLRRVASAYMHLLGGLSFDRMAAVPYAAIPIASAISVQGGLTMIYPRKEAKDYGTRATIEGEYREGETAVLIDDLATTGGSKFEAIDKLKAAGILVKDVVVLIDRESGARQTLEQAGYSLHSVLTITQLLDHWEQAGAVPADKIGRARRFVASSRNP